MSKMVSELQKLIEINIPIICIEDFDYVRIDEIISKAVADTPIREWNPSTGVTDFKTRLSKGADEKRTLADFLRIVYTADELPPSIVVLKDIQDLIDQAEIKSLLGLIAQRELYDKDFDVNIILEAHSIRIPQELNSYVSFLETELPTREDIEKIIDQHVEVNHATIDQTSKEDLLFSLKGMTRFEIDRTLDMALSKNGTLGKDDMDMILSQKKQMVKKSGLLELVEVKGLTKNSVGGMDYLKDYLERKRMVIKNASKAEKYGVSIPKGIFLVGMPGCGKSLSAKVAALEFEMPLLKMDMGSLMDKYVGESEKKLRRAISIAEAAAPCILWIDEIEKGFSGICGGNGGDSVMTRMFGYFLTWLQDKTSSVYVIATANNADNLPPELKRKGRFDEVFCVNLPNKNERASIFNVHLDKKGQTLSNYDIDRLAGQTEGFNGADIESVVNEALEERFIRSIDKGNDPDQIKLSAEALTEIIKKTASISKTCGKQIDAMRKVFESSCFKDATTGKLTNKQ